MDWVRYTDGGLVVRETKPCKAIVGLINRRGLDYCRGEDGNGSGGEAEVAGPAGGCGDGRCRRNHCSKSHVDTGPHKTHAERRTGGQKYLIIAEHLR